MGDIKTLLELYAKHGVITVPLTLWMLWVGYNWRIFHKKNGDKYDAASIRRLNWLKQDRWSNLYIAWLGTLLDTVSAVIGDTGRGKENRISRMLCSRFGFDHNPWTEPSFNLLLRIALLYPLLSFITFWLMGGSGIIGSVELLPSNVGLSESLRWGIGIALFLGLFGLFHLMRWLRSLSGWKAVFFLSIPLLFLSLIGVAQDEIGNLIAFLSELLEFVLIVTLVTLLSGLLGYGISWLFFRNKNEAIAQIKTFMWDLVVVITLFYAVFAGIDTFVGYAKIFAFAFVFAFSGAIIGAIACATAGTLAFIGTGNTVFGIDVIYGITACIASSAILYQNLQTRSWASWFWLIYLVLVLWLGFWAIQKPYSGETGFYLFWIIFPLINVPLDWLSLGVSRGLLQSIRSGQHSGMKGVIWVLADLVIALILLLLMAVILIIAIDFANDLRFAAGEDFVSNMMNYLPGRLRLDADVDLVLDLEVLLQGMENNPANPDYYWIYFMLFSTLLPTLVHFSLAGASVVLWFPAKIRHQLVKNWDNDADKKLEIWFYVSIMPVLGFVIAPTVLLYGLWQLISNFGFGIGLIHFFQFFVEN